MVSKCRSLTTWRGRSHPGLGSFFSGTRRRRQIGFVLVHGRNAPGPAQPALHRAALPGEVGRGGGLAGPTTGVQVPFLLPLGGAERNPGRRRRAGGMEVISFGVGGVAREGSVAWQRSLERSLCYSFGAWEVVDKRRPRPVDVVLGRSDGLGSSLFSPVSAPRTPIVQFFDYYYHARKYDLADEAGSGSASGGLLSLAAGGQRDRSPRPRERRRPLGARPPGSATCTRPSIDADFFVLHDGVDARRLCPTSR